MWFVGVACGVIREVYAWGGGVVREGVALVAYGVCVRARRVVCIMYVCVLYGVCVCVPCGAARKGLGIIAASLSSLTLCPPLPSPRSLLER